MFTDYYCGISVIISLKGRLASQNSWQWWCEALCYLKYNQINVNADSLSICPLTKKLSSEVWNNKSVSKFGGTKFILGHVLQ